MEDYASLREENMALEQRNFSLLNKQEKLDNELKSITLNNEDLQRKFDMTKLEAENSMR